MKNLVEYINEQTEQSNEEILLESFWSKIKKLGAKLVGDDETVAVIDKAEKEMEELAKKQKEKEKEMNDRIAALKKARKDEKELKAKRKEMATQISAEYTILSTAQNNLTKLLKAAQSSDDKVMKTWKKGKDAVEWLQKLADEESK